ncbi:MAG TPA: hypothetical protein VF039_02210 [Longimicrobiales bacterium]
MIRRGAFLGSVFTAGLILAAAGGNWLITPMRHPDAGSVRTALVVLQIVVGVGLAVWANRRIRIESGTERERGVSQ